MLFLNYVFHSFLCHSNGKLKLATTADYKYSTDSCSAMIKRAILEWNSCNSG